MKYILKKVFIISLTQLLFSYYKYTEIDRRFYDAFTLKGKGIPLQASTGPESSRKLRLQDFKTIDTALLTGRLYPQEIFLVLISVGG